MTDSRRLQRAREHGYLDARRPDCLKFVKAYGLWCWRLKIPMIWLERRSSHSKYGRVRLDMMTTANMLTAAGQGKMRALGATRASPHDACWERVPMGQLEATAHEVLRAATRIGNYQANRSKLVSIDQRRAGRLFKMGSRRAATG